MPTESEDPTVKLTNELLDKLKDVFIFAYRNGMSASGVRFAFNAAAIQLMTDDIPQMKQYTEEHKANAKRFSEIVKANPQPEASHD